MRAALKAEEDSGGGVFESNCCKQTGQREKKDFSPTVPVFIIPGVAKIRVLNANRICLVGVYG